MAEFRAVTRSKGLRVCIALGYRRMTREGVSVHLVTITKHRGLCVLNSRGVSLSSGGWKSKTNMPVDSVPGENYLPGWGNAFLLCLPIVGSG